MGSVLHFTRFLHLLYWIQRFFLCFFNLLSSCFVFLAGRGREDGGLVHRHLLAYIHEMLCMHRHLSYLGRGARQQIHALKYA